MKSFTLRDCFPSLPKMFSYSFFLVQGTTCPLLYSLSSLYSLPLKSIFQLKIFLLFVQLPLFNRNPLIPTILFLAQFGYFSVWFKLDEGKFRLNIGKILFDGSDDSRSTETDRLRRWWRFHHRVVLGNEFTKDVLGLS